MSTRDMTHSPALTLASCPMCGSATAPRLIKVEATDEAIPGGVCHTPAHFGVVCDASTESRLDGCGTAGPECPDDRSATRAWNRRAELAASADAGSRQLAQEATRYVNDLANWRETDDARLHEAAWQSAIMSIDSLAALARPAPAGTAYIPHDYQGACPDDTQPDARDPECAACRAMGVAPATMANGLTEAETSATASVAGLSVSAQGDELTTCNVATCERSLCMQTNRCQDGLVTLAVRTRHPKGYTLYNAADGTTWRGTAGGKWVAEPANAQDDERAAFEAYIHKDRGDLSTFGSGKNMHYRNGYVNSAWLGWQAREQVAQGDEVDARWQPIETAPRDSRHVIVAAQSGHTGEWSVKEAWWRMPHEDAAAEHCYWCYDGNGTMLDASVHGIGASQWQPMPAHPAARAQQGGQP